MPRLSFPAAALFSLGCFLLAPLASAQQQGQQPRAATDPTEIARVASSVADSTASLIPCVWTDFVTTLEKAAITGTWDFHESAGCDAWTSATLLDAFGGDASALEAVGYGNAASPPRSLALTEFQAYRLRVAKVPSGAVLALSPTVSAVAVAPRGPGNQGLIARAFRRVAALGRGDTVSAERTAAGRAFDGRATFVPGPFPRFNANGNATEVDFNPFTAGKIVVFVAESPEQAARARAASPSVAQPSPLDTRKSTPFLNALLSPSPTSEEQPQDPAMGYWAAEDVVTAWVGPRGNV